VIYPSGDEREAERRSRVRDIDALRLFPRVMEFPHITKPV
jgi:hypothetical protein